MCVLLLYVIVIGVIHPVLTRTAINATHHTKVRAATVHRVNVIQQFFQNQCYKNVAYETTPNHFEGARFPADVDSYCQVAGRRADSVGENKNN